MTPIKLNKETIRALIDAPTLKRPTIDYPAQPYTSSQSDTWALWCAKSRGVTIKRIEDES